MTVACQCRLLEVPRSGFYRWLKDASDEERKRFDEQQLKEKIQLVYDEWYGMTGYRRVHALLDIAGESEPLKRVRRLMKEEGLFGRPSGKRSSYRGKSNKPVASDLLRRDFIASRPNHKWVSDITEFKTKEGKLYMCQVRDLYDGVVVGWSMKDRATSGLVIEATNMALNKRMEDKELIFHSDRGTQYTSKEFTDWLREHGMTASMGAVGTSADNAAAESFFGQIKHDIGEECKRKTRAEAITIIDNYIVKLYNVLRRHSHADKVFRNQILVAAASVETSPSGTDETLGIQPPKLNSTATTE